jgi:hypothetical protein
MRQMAVDGNRNVKIKILENVINTLNEYMTLKMPSQNWLSLGKGAKDLG